MLTGKNKERFEEWFSENDYQPLFYEYPLSMQIGVIQDYADSIEWHINVAYQIAYKWFRIRVMSPYHGGRSFPVKGNRDEARTAAIKAFDEMVNQK